METILATLKDRDEWIPEGTIFWRAQRGVQCDSIFDEDGNEIGKEPHAFAPDRMRPLPNRAREGRLNAAGIAVLYLASTKQTAISEVRPWIGSKISIAPFKTVRGMKALNLSVGHGKLPFENLTLEHLADEKEPTSQEKQKAVWIDIDNAFSCPVTVSDDAADYVPTQILAEFFRNAGYDAIVYRSQFGEKGYNIALFNINDAEAVNAAPYKVKSIEVKFERMGNTWFRARPE